MKILLKAKQNPLLVLAIILVFVVLIIGYQCGVAKEAKRTAKIFEKQAVDARAEADKITEKKEAENEKLREDSTAKDKIITETKAKNVELVRKRAEDKRLMERLKGEIAKERPTELVDRARMILDTNEVWWNEKTQRAELSLQAFRGGVVKWADWDDFTFKREPDYLKQIANDAILAAQREGKILNYATEVGNLKVIIKAKDDSYGSLRGAFDEYKRAVGKKPGLLVKAFYTALGYGLGATLGK